MSITNQQIQEFIKLRALGYSFDKISKQLNISKPTLINLQKDFEKEISNQEVLEYQALLEQCKLTKQHRIKILAQSLEKILTELSRRSYEDIPTTDLVKIKDNLENSLKHELVKKQYKTGKIHPAIQAALKKDFREVVEEKIDILDF